MKILNRECQKKYQTNTQKNRVALDERGQGLTEYITLLVLIALVAVGAAKTLGTTVKEKIQTARRHIHSDINFNDVK